MASYRSSQTAVTVSDSNCIDLTISGDGTNATPYVISAAPILDPSAQNILSCGPAGLLADETTTTIAYNALTNEVTYVDEDGNPTVIDLSALAIDINVASVGYNAVTGVLTLTETDATVHTIDIGPAVLTVADTSCINLALAGAGDDVSPWVLTADPVVDPSASNLLACGVNGLTVDGTSTLFCESVQDCVGGMLVSQGFTYDDASDDFTNAGTAGQVLTSDGAGNATWTTLGAGLTCEDVQDCVDTMLDGVGYDYDDVGNQWISLGMPNHVHTASGGGGANWLPINALIGLTVTDTSCIDLTVGGDGSVGNPWVISADPIIDPLATNLLACGLNGLLVDSASAPFCEAVQDCVGGMLTGVGFTYDDAGNQFDSTGTTDQVLVSDGVGGAAWVDAETLISLQVTDTSCIGLTLAGDGSPATPWNISAVPVIDPSAQNILTCGVGGLLADETTTTLAYNGLTNELTYTDEDGAATVVDLSALAIDINIASVGYNAVTGVLTITETDASVHTVDVGPAVLTVADTSCIDLTLAGTGDDVSPWVLSASPIVDPAVTNLLTCGPAGLLVEETVTTLVDNADGTATYTSEDSTVTILDVCQMIVDGGCREFRDHLIEEGPFSGAATDTFAAHIDSPLFVGDGNVDFIYISAFDLGLDGDVTIEVAADNGATVIGAVTLVANGGQMLDFLAVNVPITGAGLHTFTYRISATTATIGDIRDIDVALDFRH